MMATARPPVPALVLGDPRLTNDNFSNDGYLNVAIGMGGGWCRYS